MPSRPSTRLGISTPSKSTAGMDCVPPTCPVCWIFASHSAALMPSPGLGKVCVSVQESTSLYAPPSSTCVVTLASRLRVKKVGE
ncbi:hypothetical protein [Nonomuraea salmonea]|uniref:hypothetical protein n=1 Tax=Nonomuraea salmonea TaxID=46181 RepID=UPI003CD05BA9